MFNALEEEQEMNSILRMKFLAVAAVLALLFVGKLSAQEPIGGPYTADNNTMILLHFEGNYNNESTFTDDGIGHGSSQFFPVGVDPSLGQCLYLDNDAQGDSSYVTIAHDPDLNLTGDWTIEGWIYVLTFGTGSSDWRWVPRLIIKPGDQVFWRPNFFVEMWGNNRFFSFGYHDASQSAWPQVNTPNNFMEPGQWYHLAFIRDTARKVIISLIHNANRQLIYFGSVPYETFSTFPPITTAQAVHIGWAGAVGLASPSTDSWLDGFVDEIRVSNIVRNFAIPPVISDVTVLPNQPTSATSYPISAKVFKVGAAGTITAVTLHYSVSGGAWSSVPMTFQGNDTYSAEIPGQSLGSIINYYIQAVDNGGLTSTSPASALTLGQYYTFGIYELNTQTLELTFEEGPGNTPVDTSPYGNPVTVVGSPSHSTNAAAGNYSLYLEGSSSYLEITTPFLAAPEFTVDFWFNMDTLEAFRRIVSLGTSTGSTNYMIFLMGDSTMTAESSIPGQPSGLRDLLKLSTKISAGQWYRINYQLSATQAWLRLYNANNALIEGKLININGPANRLDGRFRVGLLFNHSLYFGGYVDNIKVWNYPIDLVGIEPVGEPGIPERVELFQNFPNPFNPATEIQFQVNKSQTVNLAVFDMLGRKVKTLVNENVAAGKYKVTWDGTNQANQPVASGIYFYRLQTEGFSQSRKMLLMK